MEDHQRHNNLWRKHLVYMERITSTANNNMKLLRGLTQKKIRQETNLFLAEGERLVREGLEQGWRADLLAFSESALEDATHRERLFDLAAKARLAIQVPDRLMEKLSSKSNAMRVIGAFAQSLPNLPKTLDAAQKTGQWLALYEVRDPGNLGTIIRTADCLGFSGVILIGQCCDPFSVESVRASMGSLFALPPYKANWADFDNWRTAHDLPIFGAAMGGNTTPSSLDLTQPHCWLMGNEQSGLPPKIEATCDALVRIQMREGADSLNLAQATAMLTYETIRQRGVA